MKDDSSFSREIPSVTVKWLEDLDRMLLPAGYYALILPERGEGKVHYGYGLQNLKKGDWLLVHTNDTVAVHHNSGATPLSGWVLRISDAFFSSSFLALAECGKLGPLLDYGRQGVMVSQTAFFETYCLKVKEMADLQGLPLLSAVLLLFARLTQERRLKLVSPLGGDGSRTRRDTLVDRVNNYVDQHFTEGIRLETLASIAGLSKAAFCRFYKQHAGQTPFEYVVQCRIRKACLLLEHSDRTVMEVSLECGYNETALFNRHFRRLLHTTPAQFRREMKEKSRPSVEP